MDDKRLEQLRRLIIECLIDAPNTVMDSIRNYHHIRVMLDETMEEVVDTTCDYFHATGIAEGKDKKVDGTPL